MKNNFELGAQDGVEEKVASELGLRDGRGGESASSCLHTRGTEWAQGQGCWAAGEGGRSSWTLGGWAPRAPSFCVALWK